MKKSKPEDDVYDRAFKALGYVGLAFAEMGMVTSKHISPAEREAAAKSVTKSIGNALHLLAKIKLPKRH